MSTPDTSGGYRHHQQKLNIKRQRSVRKQYVAAEKFKTDQQLDAEHKQLLKILKVLEFRTNKMMEARLIRSLSHPVTKIKNTSKKEPDKQSAVLQRQEKNIQSMVKNQHLNVIRLQKRLNKISSPEYRQNINRDLSAARSELAALQSNINHSNRLIHKQANQLAFFSVDEQHKVLTEELASIKASLKLQLEKNSKLEQRLQQLRRSRNSLNPQARISKESSLEQTHHTVGKQLQPPKQLKARSRLLEVKRKMVEQFRGTISQLDQNIRSLTTHLKQSEAAIAQIQRRKRGQEQYPKFRAKRKL